MRWRSWIVPVLLSCSPAACGSSGSPAPHATTALFDASADLHSPDHFFDFPWPSDLRLTASGAPDVAGIANPTSSGVFEGLRTIAGQRAGFPQMPVAYFRFDEPPAAQDSSVVVPAAPSSPLLLIDLDGGNALVPVVASTPQADAYLPENVLTVAARPGFVLAPEHRHAFVVKKGLGDAAGNPLGAPDGLAADATTPVGKLYAPLWPALDALGIARGDVAAATVFTTGDVVADTAALSDAVLAQNDLAITGVQVEPDDGAALDGYCELSGRITYPQFQPGMPPYDDQGLFAFDAHGLPIKTRDETAPVTVTIPKGQMPSGGYPLVVYFHGTGGRSTAIADRGTWHPETDASKCPDQALDTWMGTTGCNTKGTGPGWVVAKRGIAMAASALPVNPERWPAGATRDLPEYFNVNNVAATRDIFRQGILEQRMFIAALRKLAIDPASIAACTGVTLPAGETALHFRDDPLLAQGQSMGAMYANFLSATEPRIKATTVTGAGGYWSWFILQTSFIDNLPGKIALLLDIHGSFTFMHPAMQLVQIALEPSDPMVYMPRIAQSPLPGHPTRSIYEPHGKGDSYFPTPVQDAVALAYRNQEAGTVVWPTMQDALSLAKLAGLAPYPVSQNRTSLAGAPYTGVAVQYQGDGVYDPHAIYTQLDAVKYQYGCFFRTMVDSGHAAVLAPGASLDAPCAP